MDQQMLSCMRGVEWERAKGHLRALMMLYYSEGEVELMVKFEKMDMMVDKFIDEVEDKCYHL